jgi:L-threonylcarbamoyladenylate synthase
MIVGAGVPVAAPSANRFGRISPTTGPAVEEELGGRVELILDAGPTRHGIESTIVAFDADGPRVLRPGPVTLEQLRECLGREVRFTTRARGSPASPGMMESHYAPRTPLRLMDPALTLVGRVGLLTFSKTAAAPGFAAMETLSASGDLREAAANLFGALRRLDAAGLDLIVAEPAPEHGLGVAIMDRLRKAAGPRR